MRVSFSEKKFNEEFEARILKRFPSLKSAIAAYPDRYRLELRAARWGYSEANRNADDAEANGKIIGYDLAVAELKARDAQLREIVQSVLGCHLKDCPCFVCAKMRKALLLV